MKKFTMVASFALVAMLSASAQRSEVFNSGNGAIGHYDPVAYFTENKPVRGVDSLVFAWKENNWYFVSRKNLELFKADPGKYAPQYGGYCAYGTADGHKAPTDPYAWTIVNGKLYLNYNKEVQLLWKKNQSSFIEKADSNWLKIRNRE